MKIRTAIFGVYVTASACGFAAMMGLVLREVRLRYIESMRRTMGDTAAFLAVYAQPGAGERGTWSRRLSALPPNVELLRVFACDASGRVLFDSAHGRDVGAVYGWPMRGGGRAASEDYTVSNVAEVDGELRVAAPVRLGPELVGWVGVGRALSTVAAGINEARWRLVWSLGAIAAVMVAAGWWIASRLTHSIERLTDYAIAVRDGRGQAPPQSRATEVAALARAFEEMRVALEGKAYVEHYTQTLAHELKAPLTAIRGAAELLAENPPEPERARFAANLQAETERLRVLVDRLLELAALESRRAGAVMQEVELAEVVRTVHEAVREEAAGRRIELVAKEVMDAVVLGERFLLERSLSNLVRNAVEFTPAGGKVTVSLRREAAEAVVAVEDTGTGVPDFALPRIFDRFYSLPRPDTGRKSSGLGLSIVREVARLHGGTATLENRPAGGARAELRLPLKPPHSAERH